MTQRSVLLHGYAYEKIRKVLQNTRIGCTVFCYAYAHSTHKSVAIRARFTNYNVHFVHAIYFIPNNYFEFVFNREQTQYVIYKSYFYSLDIRCE